MAIVHTDDDAAFVPLFYFIQVIVDNVSQPTLDNLHEALGKAFGIPANRVWAIKHNWSKHEWVRLTREMGVKKVGMLFLAVSLLCGVS